MHKQITSLQNPLVKEIILLKEKSKERRLSGIFVIEGRRELSLAIKGGYTILKLLYLPDLFSTSEAESMAKHGIEVIEISKAVFEKMAHRSSTEGIIALGSSKDHSLEMLNLKNNTPLILVAEAPEKPGNIGAILRTADAANLDAVIIANPKTDLYNPNIIRSSIGCLFTNNIAIGTTEEIISYLNQKSIKIYCAALQASVPYFTIDFQSSTAIVVGTEDKGLSQEWRDASTANIIIPMQGQIDSMNVSVAAGILIFEAKRQRGFK